MSTDEAYRGGAYDEAYRGGAYDEAYRGAYDEAYRGAYDTYRQACRDFPPHRYWTSSLTTPWWLNKRQVVLPAQPEEDLPNPPMATITRGYSRPGWSVHPGAFSREYRGYLEYPAGLPRFTTEYEPDHLFQVPCDTITPSSERYMRTGTIEIIR